MKRRHVRLEEQTGWLWVLFMCALPALAWISVLAWATATALGETKAESEIGGRPRVFLIDAESLARTRSRIAAGAEELAAPMTKLRQEADEALEAGPFSVVDKTFVPPSGDKHDYMSLGPYWWPDPNKPDGLPYTRRDGEVNPETRAYDRKPLGQMTSAVETPALAYCLTGHKPYAEQVVQEPGTPGKRDITIPTIDISGETERHLVIAAGTEEIYQGHATTLLLPDGKTMFCAWCLDHGGRCGPLKRSDDGGLTWSDLLPVPDNWRETRNCPAIYRLVDPQATARLFVFAGRGPDGTMHQSHSDEGGRAWTPMESNGLKAVMPFCTIKPVDGGKRLLGMTNIRRPGEIRERRSNVVAQSFSTDGGLSWSKPWEVVLDVPGCVPCEPWLIRSPDGKQLLCIMRENNRDFNSRMMTSDDEGRTWSAARQLPAALSGDRHASRYTADGRLLIAFRDTAQESPTRNHFVAWVGTYDDIVSRREGRYRVKLLHSHAGGDCGYAAIELIQRTISPDFWDVNGGPGTMFYYRQWHALVVRATPEIHERIGGVVGGLRK